MVYFLYVYDSHGKCLKISYTKVPDKMAYANSADPDLTALSGASDQVYTVCYSTKDFKKPLHKKQNFGKKILNKVFEI